ncbi:MAG: alkane 1-monooxygenase [Byssovorax sp.]
MDYLRYYLATLFMALGVAGFVLGGAWVWLGASTFLLAVVLDLTAQKPDHAARKVRYPALADVPLYLHVALLVALVAAAAWRVHASAAAGAPLGISGLAGVSVTLAWLCVLPNIPVAHELAHRKGALDRFLAFLCSVVIAEPSRRLAHLRGHHALVGLEDDADTARRGESIYAFMVRAAVGGTRVAFETERARLAKAGCSVWSWRSDVVRSIGATLAVIGAVLALAGPKAALVIALGFGAARFLLEGFNYLQHYGIVRASGTRYERRHTWSHLTPVVRAVAFEITNHAHHHMNPQTPFHALEPDPGAPQMPSALLCFVSALIPPLWTRLIAMPRLEDWDRRYATAEERALAARANAAAGWPDWFAQEAD